MSRYQLQNKIKHFPLKNMSEITFYFHKIQHFKFHFSKKQQLGDLFEKRFAGGICDFRGYPSCFVRHPIFIVLLASSIILDYMWSGGDAPCSSKPNR